MNVNIKRKGWFKRGYQSWKWNVKISTDPNFFHNGPGQNTWVNNVLRYFKITSSLLFNISALGIKPGALTVEEPKFLDFEVRSEAQLILLAESNGHRAVTTVAVSIQDVNDHAPRFTQSVYRASVSEGQLYNAHVIQVTESVCACVCVCVYVISINVYQSTYDLLPGSNPIFSISRIYSMSYGLMSP